MTNRVETKCRIKVYEVDGSEAAHDAPSLVVESHWNREEMVVLSLDGGTRRVTVSAEDLRAAVNKASGD
jgi:hypothetical protein